MAKKAYIGDVYTQVEYIESTGSQYIDTGVIPTSNTVINADFQLTQYISDTWFFSMYNAYYPNNNIRCGVYQDAFYFDGVTASQTTDLYARTQFTAQGKSCQSTLYIFAENRSGVYGPSYCKLYSFKIYESGTLIRDYVPCKNSSGTSGIYDKVNKKFYPSASSTTFVVGSEIGTLTGSNINTQIRKIYIGIDGIARKVKKAYIGIGGIARLWWDDRVLSYYGTTPQDLSIARYSLGATTLNNYAFFGGGVSYGSPSAAVDVYDTSLTKTTPTSLSIARHSLGATTIGNYALFGGGIGNAVDGSYYNDPKANVDVYNTSFTRTTITSLSVPRSSRNTTTTVGDYALFGGGAVLSTSTAVDAYNSSLSRTLPTGLSIGRNKLTSTTVGNYALFGGGREEPSGGNYVDSAVVDVYDTSLTRTMTTSLSLARYDAASTTVGTYALVCGGRYTKNNASYPYAIVDAFNTSLTRISATDLSSVLGEPTATTLENYALIGGSTGRNTMNAYDTSLTQTILTGLSRYCSDMAATSVGNYVLFGGGQTTSSSPSSKVDVYTLT